MNPPLEFSETVPLAGLVASVAVSGSPSGSPSGSLSLASTPPAAETLKAVSSSVVQESAPAVGAELPPPVPRMATPSSTSPAESSPSHPRRIQFPQEGAPYRAVLAVVTSPLGVPCSPPPWGTLLAVDLESGRVRWEVPFGTTRNRTPLPIAVRVGLPSMGGPIATASGLVFIGAALDDYLRAYDVESGAELWRARLPAGGQATPMTYRLRPDGRQYVVIAAGGHGTLGSRQGDWVVAYALPEREEEAHGNPR